MTYLTDGAHLREIAARRTVQKLVLTRGVIRYVDLRDCVAAARATSNQLRPSALAMVRRHR
jgi:hypothetical protein